MHTSSRYLHFLHGWELEEFLDETMRRYKGSNLKIQSFKLRWGSLGLDHTIMNRNSNIASAAISMGPTDVELELPCHFTFPRAPLASKTLLRLSLTGCRLDENPTFGPIGLKSLTLNDVDIPDGDALKDIISSCVSIEELSLSASLKDPPLVSPANVHELHKLSRLFLSEVILDAAFFAGFASRFPCLKDLTLKACLGCPKIEIAATSLETISFKPLRCPEPMQKAKFQVPNIRKFTYWDSRLPSHLSIKGATREWEFDVSVVNYLCLWQALVAHQLEEVFGKV